MTWQCPNCKQYFPDDTIIHECIPSLVRIGVPQTSITSIRQFPYPTYPPAPIIQKRAYKCGKCGSEFDEPLRVGIADRGQGLLVCPFCGFGKTKVKK